MQEQLSTTNPSEKQIEKLVQDLKQVNEALRGYLVELPVDERRRLLKPRPAGKDISTMIARVAGERGLTLPGISPSDIDANLIRAQRLAPLQAAASALTRSLRDTILQAQSKAWWGTTGLYTLLQGASRSDESLRRALEPAKTFFALGHRRPKTPPTK